MSLFGVDASSEVPSAAQHQVGSKFVVRYLSRYTSKVVTPTEFRDYEQNGIYLGLVFEDSATNALAGYDAGKADAEFARAQATHLLGKPANPLAMIPAAVDFDVTGREASTDAYFDGWAAVLGRKITGPYGSYAMCAHAHARGFEGLWQTYAWSGGQFFNGSKLYQYSNNHTVGGVGVDFDKCFDLSAFWNYKPADPDPHGYLKYYKGPFTDAHPFKSLNERFTVERYDTLRAKKGIRHRRELAQLRAECRALADRIARNARKDGSPVWGDGNWGSFHRMFRYRGLVARSKGQRVV